MIFSFEKIETYIQKLYTKSQYVHDFHSRYMSFFFTICTWFLYADFLENSWKSRITKQNLVHMVRTKSCEVGAHTQKLYQKLPWVHNFYPMYMIFSVFYLRTFLPISLVAITISVANLHLNWYDLWNFYEVSRTLIMI